MTREEVIKMLSDFRAQYPRFFKYMTRDEGELFLSEYLDELSEESSDDVIHAVQYAVRTMKPTAPPMAMTIKAILNAWRKDAEFSALSQKEKEAFWAEAEQEIRKIFGED